MGGGVFDIPDGIVQKFFSVIEMAVHAMHSCIFKRSFGKNQENER